MSDNFMGRHKRNVEENPVVHRDKAFDRHNLSRKKILTLGGGVIAAVLGVRFGLGPIITPAWNSVDRHETIEGIGVLTAAGGLTALAIGYGLDRPTAVPGIKKQKKRYLAGLVVAVGAVTAFVGHRVGEEDSDKVVKSVDTSTNVDVIAPADTGLATTSTAALKDGHCRVLVPIPTDEQVATMDENQRDLLGDQIEEFRTDISAAGVPLPITREYGSDIGLAVSKLEILAGLTPEQAHEEKWGNADCQRFAMLWPEQFGDYWVTQG